jgi:hypothetical protein
MVDCIISPEQGATPLSKRLRQNQPFKKTMSAHLFPDPHPKATGSTPAPDSCREERLFS